MVSNKSRINKPVSILLLRELIREVIAGNMRMGPGNTAGRNLRYGEPVIRTGDSLKNDVDQEEQKQIQDDDQKPKAACVLVIREDGKVLAVSRKDNPSAFGLPGGKVDLGEDIEQAAVRELQEETGLTATKLSHAFTIDDGAGYITTTFIADVSGEIDTPESGVVRWVEWKTLFDGPFGAYNKILYKKVYG